jgi:hypothetical protein
MAELNLYELGLIDHRQHQVPIIQRRLSDQHVTHLTASQQRSVLQAGQDLTANQQPSVDR